MGLTWAFEWPGAAHTICMGVANLFHLGVMWENLLPSAETFKNTKYKNSLSVWISNMCINIHVCVHLCVYIYIYIKYTHIYIYVCIFLREKIPSWCLLVRSHSSNKKTSRQVQVLVLNQTGCPQGNDFIFLQFHSFPPSVRSRPGHSGRCGGFYS